MGLHFQEVELGFFGAAALEAGEDFAVGMDPAEELGGDGRVVRKNGAQISAFRKSNPLKDSSEGDFCDSVGISIFVLRLIVSYG